MPINLDNNLQAIYLRESQGGSLDVKKGNLVRKTGFGRMIVWLKELFGQKKKLRNILRETKREFCASSLQNRSFSFENKTITQEKLEQLFTQCLIRNKVVEPEDPFFPTPTKVPPQPQTHPPQQPTQQQQQPEKPQQPEPTQQQPPPPGQPPTNVPTQSQTQPLQEPTQQQQQPEKPQQPEPTQQQQQPTQQQPPPPRQPPTNVPTQSQTQPLQESTQQQQPEKPQQPEPTQQQQQPTQQQPPPPGQPPTNVPTQSQTQPLQEPTQQQQQSEKPQQPELTSPSSSSALDLIPSDWEIFPTFVTDPFSNDILLLFKKLCSNEKKERFCNVPHIGDCFSDHISKKDEIVFLMNGDFGSRVSLNQIQLNLVELIKENPRARYVHIFVYRDPNFKTSLTDILTKEKYERDIEVVFFPQLNPSEDEYTNIIKDELLPAIERAKTNSFGSYKNTDSWKEKMQNNNSY